MGFPDGSAVKNSPANAEAGFDPWVRKIPWRRKWQPIPAFLPGKSHGQRNLVGYNPSGSKSWTRLSGFLYMVVYIQQCSSPSLSHSRLPLHVCSPRLHLHSCPVNNFICTIFPDSINALINDSCFSLSELTSLSMRISRSIHGAANGITFTLLCTRNEHNVINQLYLDYKIQIKK